MENNGTLRIRYHFNSHAPCGARHTHVTAHRRTHKFQLTRPVWGATHFRMPVILGVSISTHTPRVGRDRCRCRPHRGADNFNSHAPCGARPLLTKIKYCATIFQLTRPVWGATAAVKITDAAGTISTHTPRVGRDLYVLRSKPGHRRFQLTRPVWGATRANNQKVCQ